MREVKTTRTRFKWRLAIHFVRWLVQRISRVRNRRVSVCVTISNFNSTSSQLHRSSLISSRSSLSSLNPQAASQQCCKSTSYPAYMYAHLFWHTWSRRNPKGRAVVAVMKSFIGMPSMKVFSNCHHTYLEEDDLEDDFVEVVPCLTAAEE